MNRLSSIAKLALLTTLAWMAPACANETDCKPNGKIVPYCGLPNPEDLELLPDGRGVIASDMHIERGPKGIEGKPGSLKWFDLETQAVTVLYPSPSAPAGKPDWGDPACPGEIGGALIPHGFHLSRRSSGAWQLLVVNHGVRESVEFFELAGDTGHWTLSWRGCVVPPPPNRLNDVAGLADGSLLVTTMHRLGNVDAKEAVNRAQQGEDTGFLWRWRPGKGLDEQPGSASPRPNGVQVDAEGRYAYLNTAAGGGEVRKIDLALGKVVGRVSVQNPDNSSWTPDGHLLAAGMVPGASQAACFADPAAQCPVSFNVFAIDPATMKAERLYTSTDASPAAGTVALQSGRDLLIGSCFGNRVFAIKGFFASRARP